MVFDLIGLGKGTLFISTYGDFWTYPGFTVSDRLYYNLGRTRLGGRIVN